ncbi:alpha/beta hydrolase family protein [Kineococcus sp. SYSU DK004]|uniref:alpha/beta hydrolase family protein n=1 Tax=Kineococcus sp. SYSU DK004 TaxID=3383125 RepID=UPI003D7D872D
MSRPSPAARPVPAPTRRALLGLAALGGTGALAACSGGEPEPAPTTPEPAPTPTETGPAPEPTPTETEEPFVPEGLSESQRSEYRFGDHPRQVSDLWLPADGRREAIVVLVHGGGYMARTDRRNLNLHVADLVGRGWPVLNTDYRGYDDDGGGWTGTFTDVATAVDMAAEAAAQHGLPLERTAVVGHSAGGHLALWAAARPRLPEGAPGSGPRVVPAVAASMSGVLHPTALGGETGDPNVVAVFGGPADVVDQHYALGDPTRLVPLGVPLRVVHGTADDTVPVTQTQEFADAATAAGDTVSLQLFEGGTHVDPLYVGEETWGSVRDWITAQLEALGA